MEGPDSKASGPSEQLQAQLAIVADLWQLSPQHVEVLALVVQGDNDVAVSEKLGIPERSIELAVASLFVRARVHSRGELIAKVWSASTTMLPGSAPTLPTK